MKASNARIARWTRPASLILAATWSWSCAESPVAIERPTPAPQRVPHEVSFVSGTGQVGKVGERSTEPLIVKVVDQNGDPLGSVQVRWEVTSGPGQLRTFSSAVSRGYEDLTLEGGQWHTRTSPEGLARVGFVPLVLGQTLITASVGRGEEPILGSPISFDADVQTMVISMGYGLHAWIDTECWSDAWWNGTLDLDAFVDVTCSSHTVVPLGTAVEWVNHRQDESARVVSTDVPQGGTAFDSGTLAYQERFRFEPTVPGTWQFVNGLGEAQGMLTVTSPQSSAWLAAEAATRVAR